MKENELIGIAGVFVLTFLLLLLYHLISGSSRSGLFDTATQANRKTWSD